MVAKILFAPFAVVRENADINEPLEFRIESDESCDVGCEEYGRPGESSR
jgi:hypothetical protein